MLYKEGFTDLVMVVGSDRVKEFSTLLNRYNDAPDKKGNQLFKFDSIDVISAGERDPDAEGVEGMSASKMRAGSQLLEILTLSRQDYHLVLEMH